MKKCPYCAEEIQDEAVVCKHCGRDLVPGISTRAGGQADGGRGLTIIGGLGLIGGAFLPWVTMDTIFAGLRTSMGYDVNGVFTIPIGIIVALGALLAKGRATRFYAPGVILFGLLALYFTGESIARVSNYIAEGGELLTIEYGMYLSAFAALIVTVGGCWSLVTWMGQGAKVSPVRQVEG